MKVINCPECGCVFRQAQSDLCADCAEMEQVRNKQLYHYIMENPGVTLKMLSEQFGVPLSNLEQLLRNNALGMATDLIASPCARCRQEVSQQNRVGYFCRDCSKKVMQELEKLRVK